MNDLNKMLDEYKVDQIHKNTLSGIKNISEHLGIWENYSSEEKYKLENLTKSDSRLNKHFQYDGEYDTNLTYGEITKDGIDKLIEKILRYKEITNKDIFVDVGSGCGKLSLQVAVKSNIKTIVGVEIVEVRHKYANYIKEQIDVGNESVFFINKNILDFDLTIATIVFINDFYLGDDLIANIWNLIPRGCHVIMSRDPNCKILKEKFKLKVSWNKTGCDFYYCVK